MIQHMKLNQCNMPYQKKKKEKTMRSSQLKEKKILDKIQHPFMIKTKQNT